MPVVKRRSDEWYLEAGLDEYGTGRNLLLTEYERAEMNDNM